VNLQLLNELSKLLMAFRKCIKPCNNRLSFGARARVRQLFKAPTLLKHRIALALIYSGGPRSQEAGNKKISDIDFERKTIHIRQSKYKKDRIVPLSDYMAKGLKKYLTVEKPHIWLFNGKDPDGRYSSKGLSWVTREALKKAGIKKKSLFTPFVIVEFTPHLRGNPFARRRSEYFTHQEIIGPCQN
jgi:integrase